jgi:alkanesulfonate monooxygenase SsuD/methylene tetrahydromethanopterin reductase-like flavin-dependent oxidoreductase (luciferase family)
VLIGGAAGPTLFAHIAEYADGWIPIGGAGVGAALPSLRQAMRGAGRDPAELAVVLVGTIPDPGKLAYYASLGVTEVAFRLPPESPAVVRAALDRYAKFL